MASEDLLARLRECSLEDLAPSLHLNGISNLSDLGQLNDAVLARMVCVCVDSPKQLT